MQKKINSKRLVELTEVFKDMHFDSSRTGRYGDCFVINPFDTKEFDDEINDAFMFEIKPLLLSLRKKYEGKVSDARTFLFDEEDKLVYSNHNFAYPLDLKKYLDIVEKSTSYSNYLTELIDEGYIWYKQETLDYFSSKELFNDYIALEMIIEIKDVKLVKNYQYLQEKGRFDDIENHWKLGKYDEVFERVYDIFPNFCQDYLEVEELKKHKDIPDTLKKIFGKEITSHNIPQLSEILKSINERTKTITSEFNEVINDFREIRNKFGKDQGVTKENKDFENALEANKKVCSRMVIDLMKVIHNAMLVADIEKNKTENQKS